MIEQTGSGIGKDVPGKNCQLSGQIEPVQWHMGATL